MELQSAIKKRVINAFNIVLDEYINVTVMKEKKWSPNVMLITYTGEKGGENYIYYNEANVKAVFISGDIFKKIKGKAAAALFYTTKYNGKKFNGVAYSQFFMLFMADEEGTTMAKMIHIQLNRKNQIEVSSGEMPMSANDNINIFKCATCTLFPCKTYTTQQNENEINYEKEKCGGSVRE